MDTTNIYLMYDVPSKLSKIGRSDSPVRREKTLLAQSPQLHLIWYWSDCPAQDEKRLHNLFKDKRRRGEWFDLSFTDWTIMQHNLAEYHRTLCPSYFDLWTPLERCAISEISFSRIARNKFLQYGYFNEDQVWEDLANFDFDNPNA